LEKNGRARNSKQGCSVVKGGATWKGFWAYFSRNHGSFTGLLLIRAGCPKRRVGKRVTDPESGGLIFGWGGGSLIAFHGYRLTNNWKKMGEKGNLSAFQSIKVGGPRRGFFRRR